MRVRPDRARVHQVFTLWEAPVSHKENLIPDDTPPHRVIHGFYSPLLVEQRYRGLRVIGQFVFEKSTIKDWEFPRSDNACRGLGHLTSLVVG